MNITDEFAKVVEEWEKINSKYNELFEKIFQELNKYLSFIDMRKINLRDKTLIYENYDNQINIFKVALFFNPKERPLDNSFCFVTIKSSFNKVFLENIIDQFCIANKLVYEDLS